MTKTVYVETSVPSFFHEARQVPEMVARRAWTRQWWAVASQRYDLVTSPAVVDELEQGEYPSKDDCIRMVEKLEILESTSAVLERVDTYISRHVMPADPAGDGLRLAWRPLTDVTSWSHGTAGIWRTPTSSVTFDA